MDDEPRFTVEPYRFRAHGIGDYAIRFTPPARQNPDGSITIKLSFPCLIAGGFLADQRRVLQQVADVLNASPIGQEEREERPEPMDMTHVLDDC